MANITVTLLTSKRTRQTVDALDSVVAAQAGGYVVVEGEEDSTIIEVRYPDEYKGKNCYVYMKNARGEYDTHAFTQLTSAKTFTLPGSMTYAGNTILVFYATDGKSTTAWLPVIVPVAETGVDYKRVATASEDFLKDVLKATGEAVRICTEVKEQAENGDFDGQDGKSVFIRYSASPNGSDMTETWKAGQRYLGTFISNIASSNPNDYTWMLFVGDAFCEESNAPGAVTAQLVAYADKTYTSTDLTSLTVIIPNNVKHGFYAGINFRTVAQTITVAFTNFSSLPLKLIVSGVTSENYSPGQNKYVRMIFDCDGVNIYCTIVEV